MIEFSKTRAPKSELLCRVEPSGIKHKSLSYEDIRITRYSLVVMPYRDSFHSYIIKCTHIGNQDHVFDVWKIFYWLHKRTVNVISCDQACTNCNARFTTVPFKYLSDQVWIRYQYYWFWKLIIFNCGFAHLEKIRLLNLE